MNKSPIVIFSGSNERAVTTFCRYAEQSAIKYVIIANGNDDPIFLSDYSSKVFQTRKKNHLDFSEFLILLNEIKIYFNTNHLFVIPITEYLNRFLLQNRSQIEEKNISFGLCSSEVYSKISDKYSFGELCISYGINVPQEFVKMPDVYPFVIKPKKYFNEKNTVNIKPIIVYNKEEIKKLDFKKNDIYYQEYIGGKSIYFLFYFFKNGSYSVYSQENLIQQHEGGSMILCKSSNYHIDSEIVQKLTKLFNDIKFTGLVMVETKLYNEKFYMIEANPRPWGPLQLTLNSKMTLLDDFSIDNDITNIRIFKGNEFIENSYYFWSGGITKTLGIGKDLSYHDFNRNAFLNNYDNIIKSEIYLKNDTINIYLKENL